MGYLKKISCRIHPSDAFKTYDMQRNLLSLLLLTVTVISIVSCNRTDKGAIAVPKDAAVVMHINTSSLISKVSWQEIKETDWFKNMYYNTPDSFTKKLLDDPGNSGIDIQSELVIFV